MLVIVVEDEDKVLVLLDAEVVSVGFLEVVADFLFFLKVPPHVDHLVSFSWGLREDMCVGFKI